VLGRLRDAGVTLAEVIGQYHARGVVPLRRRPLRLREMTANGAPWEGTVTALLLLSSLEVQCRVGRRSGDQPTRGHRRGYSRCSPTWGQRNL
jgi:hypothetical protein